MTARRASLLILFVVFVLAQAIAQNPILGPPAEPESAPAEQSEDSSGPAATLESGGGPLAGRLSATIRRWSSSLQRRIAELSRRVRSDGDLGAAVLSFLAAVLFGAIHIAGPGHGKVFALSYFSSREARPADGIAYSVVVNIIDSLSAFAIVFLGYVVLRALFPAFRTTAPQILEIVSYSIIVLFGVGHLLSHLTGHHDHDHANLEATDESHEHGSKSHRRELRPWMLAVTVGLIPCPVSTILLVYGVVNGVLGLMILMVIGVSVGGFLTMSVISLAVIAGRRGLLSRLSSGTAARVTTALEFVSSGLIITVGVLLLLASVL